MSDIKTEPRGTNWIDFPIMKDEASSFSCSAIHCSSQAFVGQSKNNRNYKDCSLENVYAADFNGQKSLCIWNLIKIRGCCFRFWYIDRPSPYWTSSLITRKTKLCSFCKPIAHGPCMAKIVLFNITRNRFGITPGLLWLVVVKNIIRAKTF